MARFNLNCEEGIFEVTPHETDDSGVVCNVVTNLMNVAFFPDDGTCFTFQISNALYGTIGQTEDVWLLTVTENDGERISTANFGGDWRLWTEKVNRWMDKLGYTVGF